MFAAKKIWTACLGMPPPCAVEESRSLLTPVLRSGKREPPRGKPVASMKRERPICSNKHENSPGQAVGIFVSFETVSKACGVFEVF